MDKKPDDHVMQGASLASVPKPPWVVPPALSSVPTFSDLYKAHLQKVARWAARLAGPFIEAEDIVQEVFLIAHRQLPTFRGEALVSTWLFSITQNVVRHRRRRETVRRFFLASVRAAGHANDLPAGPTPIEELLRREATRDLYRVLDRLAEKYRTIFILFEVEGLSGPEISALTGLPAATLRVQLFRARALLQKQLAALTATGKIDSRRYADLFSAGEKGGES